MPLYVNVAVLKETRPHERRVPLVPAVAAKLITLGAKIQMQTGWVKRAGFRIRQAVLVKMIEVVRGLGSSAAA